MTYSALFVVSISFLGLLELASLAVVRRTKEIGIRKVLGASVESLVGLLSRDFATLIIGANVISWPIAYWAMDKWLMNFAYRIELGFGVFIVAGLMVVCVALLTICAQTFKAARRDPVIALRYEYLICSDGMLKVDPQMAGGLIEGSGKIREEIASGPWAREFQIEDPAPAPGLTLSGIARRPSPACWRGSDS